jgi:hypothetical protein
MNILQFIYDKNQILIRQAINAAAPEGTPPRRINNQMSGSGNLLAPPCLGEALRWGTLVTEYFSGVQ